MPVIQCPAEKHIEMIDEKARQKRIPLSVHMDITYRCNLKCVHCYCQGLSEEFTGGRPEMPTERIFSLLDELADAGTLNLTLSGGEIFVHPDFFKIADYARKKHFCISFITNGTLIDRERALRLTGFYPKTIQFSLYGKTAEVHDSVTSVPGSFEKTINAIRLLRELGNRIVISTVVMDLNYSQAKDMPDFALSLGAFKHIWTAEISRKNDFSRIPQERQIGVDGIRSLYEALDAASEPAGISEDPAEIALCSPGVTSCSLSAFGDVWPCIQLVYPMGNVQDRSFARVWHDDCAVRRELEGIRRHSDLPECLSCDYVRYCKKCIGLAYLETKDMRKCYNTLRSISRIEYELINNKRRAHEGKEEI